MTKLQQIIKATDLKLNTDHIPDYGGAHNGLQLTNDGSVSKIAAAVDASLPVINEAVREGADLLLVHHGMFWQGVQPVVGAFYEKLKMAMDANLAIYSTHIPLDIHPEIGNNVLLADLIGLEELEPFFDWKGIELGLKGRFKGEMADLVAATERAVGGSVHQCEARSGVDVGVVGLITGGAGSEVAEIAKLGVDTFITGEGPHWSYTAAEELGLNVIYAGHYATETYGVQELAKWVSESYEVPWMFIDHPSGL